MTTTYPAGVKITTPILSQGGRGNWALEIDGDLGILTVHHPMAGVQLELVLSGEHLEQFVSEVARQARAARKARLKAVNE